MFGIEVSLPPGWTRVLSEEFAIAFAGPPLLGYRPMLVMSHEDLEGAPAEAVEMLLAHQALESPGYDRIAERTEEIDGCWAHVSHHRWNGDGVPVTQLLAVLVVEPGRVLKVDGVCLTDLESRHLPLLDHIATSITLPRAA